MTPSEKFRRTVQRLLKTPPKPHRADSQTVDRLVKVVPPGRSEFDRQEARKARAKKKKPGN